MFSKCQASKNSIFKIQSSNWIFDGSFILNNFISSFEIWLKKYKGLSIPNLSMKNWQKERKRLFKDSSLWTALKRLYKEYSEPPNWNKYFEITFSITEKR